DARANARCDPAAQDGAPGQTTETAREAPCRQGVRLRTLSSCLPPSRDQAPDRTSGDRIEASARPSSLGRGTHLRLDRALPTPDDPLRAARGDAPRLPS